MSNLVKQNPGYRPDRPLKLLLIDSDPIFRLGLSVALEQVPNVQVVESAETAGAALKILAELSKNNPNAVNLVVLELNLDRSDARHQLGLQLCRQLKTQYPNLPVLLLSSIQEPSLLEPARAAGVDGYCPKGITISELVAVMRQVATGRSYWFAEQGISRQADKGRTISAAGNYPPTRGNSSEALSALPRPSQENSYLPFARVRNNLRWSGITYINATLAEVNAQLEVPGLPLLDQAVLAGHRRELLAARWLLNHLLLSQQERPEDAQSQLVPSESYAQKLPSSSTRSQPPVVTETQAEFLPTSQTLQSILFESILAKLQFRLVNLTDVPLEIDILREDKKRELLHLILQKVKSLLKELRSSESDSSQLHQRDDIILRDLWEAVITDFFGKYSTLEVGNRYVEIVSFLLQDAVVVQIGILDKIPLVGDLFSYLLFQTPLLIDNVLYPFGSAEATARAEIILQNLLIQLANSVVQPLLNRLGDVETIKQSFYNRQMISTREIERFRNSLSWRYRVKNYITEPKEIFESRYELFVLAPRGVAKISIYAPRREELVQLSGIPFVVTLALEFRDAIAPRLRAAVAFIGSGVVYVLTQVVGRAIGLIGRGILQGIGSTSLSERKNKKF